MIESDVTTVEELLLHDEDFPNNYINMAHPDDYKETNNFSPEYICHSYHGRHNRLIARVAWKISNNNLIPMSFVCDTGAPSHMYLSKYAYDTLEKHNRILTDDRGNQYVKIHLNKTTTFNANIEETPHIHKNANIIGLKALKKLHLALKDDTFSFNENFQYL